MTNENNVLDRQKKLFASTEQNWRPWIDYYIKNYYLAFLKNFQQLNLYLQELNQKTEVEISDSDLIKIKILYNLFSLFDLIKIDQNQDVILNLQKIANFKEISDDEIIEQWNSGCEQLIIDIKDFLIIDGDFNYFEYLEKHFEFILLFYNDQVTREQFYLDNIQKETLEIDQFLLKKHKMYFLDEEAEIQ